MKRVRMPFLGSVDLSTPYTRVQTTHTRSMWPPVSVPARACGHANEIEVTAARWLFERWPLSCKDHTGSSFTASTHSLYIVEADFGAAMAFIMAHHTATASPPPTQCAASQHLNWGSINRAVAAVASPRADAPRGPCSYSRCGGAQLDLTVSHKRCAGSCQR